MNVSDVIRLLAEESGYNIVPTSGKTRTGRRIDGFLVARKDHKSRLIGTDGTMLFICHPNNKKCPKNHGGQQHWTTLEDPNSLEIIKEWFSFFDALDRAEPT
jgi:hypothetical protein